MRNIINYAKAIKDIVYVLTQEEVLLDTKVEIGAEFTMTPTTTMKNVTISVPDEYEELDEQDAFILDYINDKYGLELESVYDNCLFAILHEIGHIIDYSHKRNKWGKMGETALKRYANKDYKIKAKLDEEYFENVCAIEMLHSDLRDIQGELNDRRLQLLLEVNQDLLSDNCNPTRNEELLRECDDLTEQYNMISEDIIALNETMIELEQEMSYNYRQITTEYEADKWAALMIKNYGAQIKDYITALEII